VANEIVYSGLGDQRLTEVLAMQWLDALADRNFIGQHPAIFYGGDAMGKGSLAVKVPIVGLNGYDLFASQSEAGSIANTALTDTSVVCTVARAGKAYAASDMARFSDPNGSINPQKFMQDAVTSAAMWRTNLIANLMDNFATVVGTTTVDSDLSVFLAAQDALEIGNVPAPYLALLHSRQWRDIVADMALAVGGAVQYQIDAGMLAVNGQVYKGTLLGTDVFVSNQVPTMAAGADRGGGMFGRGAVVFCDSTLAPENDPNIVDIDGKLRFERERVARSSTSAWISTVHMGVVEGIDLAGVTIQTDA
jgi:hypothetical protein